MTKVVSITGDTTVCFPIEYLADEYYKTCENLAASGDDGSSAIGRVTVSVLNEVVSVNTAATTPVGLSVWMGAGPNFRFSMPDDFPSGWALDTSLPPVSKQSSIRAMFSAPAEGLVPTTLLEEKGICAPEPFTGPIDLLKRFTVKDAQAGATQVYRPGYADYINQSMTNLILPFQGWRGGWRYKITPTNGVRPARMNIAWESVDDPVCSLSGRTYSTTSVNPVLEAEFPFYDQYAWRETFPVMSMNPRPQVVLTTSTADPVDVWEAVADDYSLGLFLGCPPVLAPSSENKTSALPGVRIAAV